MFPVLFTMGKIPISSFGVILAIGILVGVFLIWRLVRAWDLDEEKVLDLSLLTFLGGLIGARLLFALTNLDLFHQNIFDIFFFNKIPGFSFWGALMGGASTLYFFSKKKRLDFWILSDIASIGLIAGLIFAEVGCFFGGCNVGIPSKLFFAVNMEGLVGRRFPVQILEALLLLLVVIKLWSLSVHFHQKGKILSLSLIYLGIIDLLTYPFKADKEGIFLPIGLVGLGIYVFYKITKRSLKSDIKYLTTFIKEFLTDPKARKLNLERFSKYWYNRKTQIFWNLRNLKKGLKKFNVRISLKNN